MYQTNILDFITIVSQNSKPGVMVRRTTRCNFPDQCTARQPPLYGVKPSQANRSYQTETQTYFCEEVGGFEGGGGSEIKCSLLRKQPRFSWHFANEKYNEVLNGTKK